MSTENSSIEKIRQVGRQLSNWGRWGAEDQRGTLNHITPDAIKHACTLVKSGRTIRLGLNYDLGGPQLPMSRGKPNPRFNPIHTMLIHAGDGELADPPAPLRFGVADDMVIMPLQCSTQWDGLAHVFYDGKLYNGYSTSEVVGTGAAKIGIEHLCEGIVGRGVLLDMAGYKKVDELPPGSPITTEDLERCAESEGVGILPGDILLVRTGLMQHFLAGDRARYGSDIRAGLSFYTLEWIHRQKIAAVATDTLAVEMRPSEFPGVRIPFHLVGIRDMGLLLGEIFNLEAIAKDCADDGIYEFLFTGSPLPITRAIGSPLNPLAIK